MRRITAITLIVSLLTILTGCIWFSDFDITPMPDGSHTDFDGIYITIDSVKVSDGKRILLTSWHNETDRDVTYGKWYTVEYLEDGEWRNVQKKDFAVIEIACMISPSGTSEESYSMEYFSLSKYGTYRLRSEFWLGDGVSYSIWTEFSVNPIE